MTLSPDQAHRFMRVMEPLTPTGLDLDDLAACLAVFEHIRDCANQPAQVVFELAAPLCRVNGASIPSHDKGIVIAWCVLAAHQCRLGDVRVDWFYGGATARTRALQALDRAADAVSRYSAALASAIGGIGTRRGCFVLNASMRGIRCASPQLADAVRA